jgi:hypothetical protein
VKDALHELTWVSDIRGALGWQGLVEYLDLWDVLTDVILHGTDDTHHWKFEASGNFSSKSAYRAFFAGSVSFEPWKRLWKYWAPSKCKTFIWLAIVTSVGRLTVYKKEGSLTLLAARCATKKKRQSNIYSPHVSSPDSFGLASFNH